MIGSVSVLTFISRAGFTVVLRSIVLVLFSNLSSFSWVFWFFPVINRCCFAVLLFKLFWFTFSSFSSAAVLIFISNIRRNSAISFSNDKFNNNWLMVIVRRKLELHSTASCDSYASLVLSNLPRASITLRTDTNHEPIVFDSLLSGLVSPTPLKACRHVFQWLDSVIIVRPYDYGALWLRKQIAWRKLRDFAGCVISLIGPSILPY